MNRRKFIAASTLALAASSVASPVWAAEEYPSRPIRLIVPFPAGGSTDILARVVSSHMSIGLGQSVVVDNKPGASTMLGVEAAARAPHDGYTLLLAVATSLSTNPHFVQNAVYKSTDFAPVGFISKTPVIMLAHPSVPVKTVAELVAYMKKNPGKLRTGTTGPGAFSHLCALMFGAAAGVKIDDVPYRGESPAITALLSDEVQLYFASLPAAMPHIQDNKVIPLAVTSESPSPSLPQVPSFVDAGFPGVVANAWFGIVAPAGTSNAIVQRLHKEVAKATSSKETQERMRSDGAVPQAMTPDEFAKFMLAEYNRWGPILSPLRETLAQ